MISVCRKFEFCYGHRLYEHKGKCANIHGHNAVVMCYIKKFDDLKPSLNSEGMVIDFCIVKERLGEWINKNWDHKFLFYEKDNFIDVSYFPPDSVFPCSFNPTAENLAEYLRKKVCSILFNDLGIEVYRIDFYETSSCFAISEKEKIS